MLFSIFKEKEASKKPINLQKISLGYLNLKL